MRLAALLATACLMLSAPAHAEKDPLDSVRWEDMRAQFFSNAEVVFDDRVRVSAPVTAEDSLQVPIAVDAAGLGPVQEVLVFAEFNPIVRVLSFEPQGAAARLAFRIKLQQSSPVRAAARTPDGVWHVGGTWVNTTGGGCTLPSTGSASPVWQTRLNEVSGRIWVREDGSDRVRVRLIHPMDTGLAPRIPAFYIETLELATDDGKPLMRIRAHEPVAENPLFTLDLPPTVGDPSRIRVSGRDNNGNLIQAWVER